MYRLLLFMLLLGSVAVEAKKSVQFFFYEELIEIEYDERMHVPLSTSGTSEDIVRQYYQDINNANMLMVVSNLFYYKKELNLNDWLFYLLVAQTADTIFSGESENYRTLFCWFILQRCGYVVQLGYDEQDRMAVSVFTGDLIYEAPISKTDQKIQEVFDDNGKIEVKQGYFVDLTAVLKQTRIRGTSSRFTLTRPVVDQRGRAFSFVMTELPTFSKVEHEKKRISFIHDNKLYAVDAVIDKSIIYALYKYPQMVVENHLKTPLSPVCLESMRSSLLPLLENQSPYEAVRMLLSFTRQVSDYGEDYLSYRRNNLSLFAEETLFYPKSDCEDRAILFCYLAKELLGLEVLLIDYPEHAAAAVLLDQAYGSTHITHEGKTYSVCDPTGPGNHLKIGEVPPHFRDIAPKILRD
ncbi:MAG: transglutaminase domain-containing protein [Sphingobacteriales bacterium]|nr:transglutaminase domain-containing protein [Sphingobacteriales bacterium]